MKRVLTLSILIFPILMITACSGEGSEVQGSGGKDTLVFGTGTFENGIMEQKSTFTQDENFLMETTLSEPFGTTDVKFMILRAGADGSEEIYEQWSDTVDPTWEYFVYEFQKVELNGVFDKGDYIVRLFTNESDLIAEGGFSIQ